MNDFQNKLEQYAQVTLEIGLGFRAGQRLMIRADVNAAPTVRAMVRAAYQRGARFVEVLWEDEYALLARHELAPRDSFETISAWAATSLNAVAERGDALLMVVSDNPRLFEQQDAALVQLEKNTMRQAMIPVYQKAMTHQITWCVVAASSEGWAHNIFPTLEPAQANEKLWAAIFQASGMNHQHPLEYWQAEVQRLKVRREVFNANQYSSLRFTGPGTKLEVGLVDGHIWSGGQTSTPDGVLFAANIPTYEIFTMPHRERTNGIVCGTKPTVISGSLVEGWTLEFKDGLVIKASAERGESVLHALLETDEGAKRLGEVALVPGDSPVGQTGILFQNTLFDENAACHIALGRAYPTTITNGAELEPEEMIAKGVNTSLEHHDVMVGSNEVDVDGIFANGSVEPLMRAGQFVFES